jgi:hypothetical protein
MLPEDVLREGLVSTPIYQKMAVFRGGNCFDRLAIWR